MSKFLEILIKVEIFTISLILLVNIFINETILFQILIALIIIFVFTILFTIEYYRKNEK